MLAFLDHWWNVPFLVMLGLVAVFTVMQFLGLATGGGAGDKDLELAHGGADKDVDVGHAHGGGGSFLSFIGIGKVPLLVVWTTLCFAGGATGLLVNYGLYDVASGLPAWGFPLALLLALVVGVAAVRVAARAFARVVDVGGKGATSKRDLVGRPGAVASARLDERHGEVRVHDGEHEIIVHGKLAAGEAALARGARVVLVDYDEKSDLYWVTASPDAA